MAIPLLSPVVALIGSQVVGALWYSPLLFGKRWASYAYPGRRFNDLGLNGAASCYAATAAAATLWIIILNYIFRQAFVAWNLEVTIQFALLMSALVCAVQVPHYAFEGKSLKHFLINGGFDTAVIIEASLAMYFLGA